MATDDKSMESNGLAPLPTEDGVRAFDNSLNLSLPRVMVLDGDPDKIGETMERFGRETPRTEVPARKASPEAVPAELKTKTAGYLAKILAREARITPDKIKSNQPFEVYGINSVMIVDLTRRLEKKFGRLSKTLFFEYETLDALAGYFSENHGETLMKEIGPAPSPATRKPPVKTGKPDAPVRSRFSRLRGIVRDVAAGDGDIAVIGVAGRYPMAGNLDELWENLKSGRDCITEIPENRWDYLKYEDKIHKRWGGFIEDADKFDPLFFNIAPREAELMDPQERLFLETAWHAIEDGGYTRNRLWDKSVGVFVGVMYSEYQYYGAEETLRGNPVSTSPTIAAIANRVSYYFNFKGPCMGLDTMCSSSLTAIHLARASILNGDCELALAGGVNLSLHPQKYIYLSRQKFASSDGRCRSFGEGGDGYVPGEGVGAVLLKSLEKAIADKDNIYAVIKATSLNHGGKTHGVTVPNPNAQASLIESALEKAGIDPGTISYVEAHGTGTSLGDPIEITGLSKAFQSTAREKQFCPIGSIKSNIGHLESAAGIAGISKILLQMKHKTLVPSIHSETLNPNIEFGETPFYVQRELGEWKRPVIDGKPVPRRAGISSFGAGGSNAHIILEEFDQPVASDVSGEQLIVLSAGNRDRLRICAENLSAFLELDHNTPANLADIAHTLQTGREAMEERLAFVVSTTVELKEKLGRYKNRQPEQDVYSGNVKTGMAGSDLLLEGEAGEAFLRIILEKKELTKIARLWVAGVDIDWELMHADQKPARISLPLYPFSRTRYWLETSKKTSPGAGAVLHPMLDANESTLEEQCYVKTFRPDEFFIRDHVVGNEKILPGAAYIEMARAAGVLAGGKSEVTKIGNIVWASPVRVEDGPQPVRISLYPEDGHVEFEVSSINGRRQVHASGVIHHVGQMPENGPADLERIKSRCPKNMTGEACYKRFAESGLRYGPGFQTIRELRVGDKEALARLVLPKSADRTFAELALHPSLMDGAFQTVMGLSDNGSPETIWLPFALKQVDVVKPPAKVCYAHVTAGESQGDVVKFDIRLLDEAGHELVRMKEFTARAFKSHVETDDVLYYRSVWEKSDSGFVEKISGSVLVFDKDGEGVRAVEGRADGDIIRVMPGETYGEKEPGVYTLNPENPEDYFRLIQSLEKTTGTPEHIVYLWKGDSKLRSGLTYGFYALFRLSKALITHASGKNIRILHIFHEEPENPRPVHAAAGGLARTVNREHPNLAFKTIAITGSANLADLIPAELQTSDGVEIRYENNERHIRKLLPIEAIPEEQLGNAGEGAWIITGGAGGLGLVFAKHLSGKPVSGIALVGRSDLGPEKMETIDGLNREGAEVVYLKADIADEKGAEELIQEVKRRFGRISGVIHGAGVIRDGLVVNKTEQDIKAVLAPKVYGTVHLDRATENEDLDYFILFSSVAGVMGNPGQSDYAYGNSFLDNFARFRETLRNRGKRSGKTLSVNWPLWSEGGMGVDENTLAWLKNTFGIVPLKTNHGVRAFEDGLKLDDSQVMVLEGVRQKLEQTVDRINGKRPEETKKSTIGAGEKDALREKVEEYLKTLLSGEIKLDEAEIRSNEPLEKYGIDSVMVLNLTRELETRFGELSKTLFFEYRTIDELAGYFIENHGGRFMDNEAPGRPAEGLPLDTGVPVKAPVRSRFARPRGVSERKEDDIAIIGLSGRYPMANDPDAFWRNLEQGRDCLIEIPETRWDHGPYFDPDKKPGKMYNKWGGFIEDADKFDPLFFDISPREAELMDPQERVFLETAWGAVEDAAYTRTGLWGKDVGVFAGVMYAEYILYGARDLNGGDPFLPASSFASVANHVSYYFNFKGPSIGLDTMCSSSLTAIHLASQSIKRGECDMAIAGGVNLSLHPYKYLLLSERRFASTDGKCRAFGQGGDGYVPGEGVGAVLLKPLSKAVADGDHIYGVIKSSALNHGGKTNGYTVPNPNAQARVIGRALSDAGINPRTISYMEAHGTGTSLGDPIEITGLGKAFREHTQDTGFCAIGSVKSNIGHCESAAGIAGITKVLLQLKHRKLAPSLHADPLNPHINFDRTPFVVRRELGDWKRPVISDREVPRRAGISSFGAGGANAHVIIEEYKAGDGETSIPHRPVLIVLSARDGERLEKLAGRLESHIGERQLTDADLPNIAYTLQTGREPMEERLAMTVNSIQELREKLEAFIEGRGDVIRGRVKRHKETLAVFEPDDELKNQVNAWITDRNYSELAAQWVRGMIIDWRRLYGEVLPRRISLPVYPFARERFWVPEGKDEKQMKATFTAPKGAIPFDEKFYDRLLDEVTRETIGVDEAVRKIRKGV